LAEFFNEDQNDMRVTEIGQDKNSWTFMVEIGRGDGLNEYMVILDREYWTRLTNRRVEPEELVKVTFHFLLEKEPKELILKKFNISDVQGHFPGYEIEVKRSL
jgi:hypothetical protein